jgi:hypothetical protein
MKIWAVALISMMLVGCATTPVPLHTERLFRDHLFAAPPARISADDVFAFNDDNEAVPEYRYREPISLQRSAAGPH